MSRTSPWLQHLSAEVVREAVWDGRFRGVVITVPGPEARLLRSFLEGVPGLVLRGPDPEEVGVLRKCLPGVGRGGGDDAEPFRIAAWRLAAREGLLPVHPAHKTLLLLSPLLPPEPVLPFGDVYASRLRPLAGGCTLPPVLRNVSPDLLAAVDAALRARTEEELPWEQAAEGLPSGLAEAVGRALERGRWGRTVPPLVPKVGRRTIGVDLDL